jgi:nucleoside-diphosphate-sugar epimerase
VGNPDEYTVKQLAELVVELTGTKAPIVYEPLPTDDPKVRKPDITRARTMLGWEPKVHVRDGLARTIEYFQAHVGTPMMAPRTPRPRPPATRTG